MVTMSSEKGGARRIDLIEGTTISNIYDQQNTQLQSRPQATNAAQDDSPNQIVFKKMENVVERMQKEDGGVPVRTIKAFMSKVPSVFTGTDLINWIVTNMDIEDPLEASHFAHLMASHGYLFPIDDHFLTVKNDGSFYRFQTPYFWPSNNWEPENTDYAVYLCKRTMQNKTRLELSDYEAESLARLQKMFSRKWEFIFMQAEAQSKVDKKRDKLERKVLDSQERAFWDVHRPMPGCVNTTEIDIKKACRGRSVVSNMLTSTSVAGILITDRQKLTKQIELFKQKLERRAIKVSKVAESYLNYNEQYAEFDYFLTTPEMHNPWICDNIDLWESDKINKEVPLQRVKRWAYSFQELLKDPAGREHFMKFLDKEFSSENLKFWDAVRVFKSLPQSEIKARSLTLWEEFLAPDAIYPVNVDSRSLDLTKIALFGQKHSVDRWCFDVAASHVYHLMKTDSYSRYLRSEMYKEFLNGSRKKVSVKGLRSIVSFSARKDSPQAQ